MVNKHLYSIILLCQLLGDKEITESKVKLCHKVARKNNNCSQNCDDYYGFVNQKYEHWFHIEDSKYV